MGIAQRIRSDGLSVRFLCKELEFGPESLCVAPPGAYCREHTPSDRRCSRYCLFLDHLGINMLLLRKSLDMCRPEAIHLDGQQRLLLEQAFETLSASPAAAAGAALSTAVIVGIGTVEYNTIAAHLGNGIYVATGDHLRMKRGLEVYSPFNFHIIRQSSTRGLQPVLGSCKPG